MKLKVLALSAIALVILTSAKTMVSQDEATQKLIGTWKWTTVINAETKEELGIDMITMGMASEVRTEFKKDNTYAESKVKADTKETSTTNGEWKFEGADILSLKMKEKLRPSKILKFTKDSLLLQMNPKMNLLLVKQK